MPPDKICILSFNNILSKTSSFVNYLVRIDYKLKNGESE